MEEYKEKYEMALEGIQEILDSGEDSIKMSRLKLRLQGIFPELKESEDEKVRKELFAVINDLVLPKEQLERFNAYLEKLKSVDEIVERCKNSWYNEGKIAGQAEGLKDDEKYWQGYHDALEKQDGQKPAIEMKSPEESLGISSEQYNDIVNQCLFGEPKSTDKNEPRFRLGDWVVTSYGKVNWVVTGDDNKGFTLDDGTYLSGSGKDDYHLWSIADAKRGDVLASPLSIFIFKRIYMAGKPEAYCGLMMDTDDFIVREPGCWTNNKCWPATKEQRERLFSKMKKSGYKWDVKNRELISLPPVSKPSEVVWSDEDETGFNDTLWAINKARTLAKDENDMGNLWYAENWLRELKERIKG